jgi:hypothetical protein
MLALRAAPLIALATTWLVVGVGCGDDPRRDQSYGTDLGVGWTPPDGSMLVPRDAGPEAGDARDGAGDGAEGGAEAGTIDAPVEDAAGPDVLSAAVDSGPSDTPLSTD